MRFSAAFLYTETTAVTRPVITVENGIITEMTTLDAVAEDQRADIQHFSNAALIPGLVNSHTHAFQSLLKGYCDDEDFFTWRNNALYKYSQHMTRDDIYTGALFAFAEMLKNGITTVCDFFYINDQSNDNAQAIIQAAQDLGIRLTLARCMYDWDGAPKRYQETVDQALENTQALIQAYQNHPSISILPAPHSFHGASLDMIQAGVALAKEHNLPWHMHIAEGQYEREMIESRHGASPIRLLHRMGLLDHDTVGIHCVWLDDEEVAMMGDVGAGLSYNPSSNMFLGDGITRIVELQKAGVCISLGTDGGCSNNRASIVEEMRMTNLLQKVRFCDATQTTAESAFAMGTANGGRHLRRPVGKLAVGYAADFVVVNLNDLSMQPGVQFIKNLVYALMPSALQAVYVGGKAVMQNGQLLRIPESDVVARIQQTTQRWQTEALA